MKWGHFYMLDQWEFRVDQWSGTKELYHTPCDSPVHRARHGSRWVCTGCYTEAPDEILDVIYLDQGEIYKGWSDPEPLKLSNSTFYFYTPPYNHFYGITISEPGYLTNPPSFYIICDFNANFNTNYTIL